MSCLTSRLYGFVEHFNILPEYQFGFRRGFSCASACTILKEMIRERFDFNKTRARNVPAKRLYACFFDFSKAFDSVDRFILFKKLLTFGVPFSVCETLFYTLSKLKMCVKKGDNKSASFTTQNGLPQGDPASALLFSLFIADLPEFLPRAQGPLLSGTRIPYLLFADDLCVLADSKVELERACESVVRFCSDNNLTLNFAKTKYIVFHKGPLPIVDKVLTFNDQSLTRSNTFCYLGVTFSSQLSFAHHASKLVAKANSKIGYLFAKLPLANMSLAAVMRVFNTYIIPSFRYNLPIWFSHGATYSKKIDSMFTKFLKRYMRAPVFFNNGLILTSSQKPSLFLSH